MNLDEEASIDEEKKTEQLLDSKTLVSIKSELNDLIHRHSNVYELESSKQEIHLCNKSNPIQFNKTDASEVRRFIGLVGKEGVYLKNLITHLDYNSETKFVESKSIVGNVDIEKTRVFQANQSSNGSVVCTVYKKNLFTPENLVLGALLLSIRYLAKEFLGKISPDKENSLHKFQNDLVLIENFSNLLLNDRFVNKICKYYLQNFESPQQIFSMLKNRRFTGKIPLRYMKLLTFLEIWQMYEKVQLEKQTNSFAILANRLDLESEHKLYELWVFYKTLEIFSKPLDLIKQEQSDHSVYKNSVYEIEYQYSKRIGWTRDKEAIPREPDVVIKKNGEILAIIDAKHMQLKLPLTSVENQMLIYLDYGKKSEKSNLAIVLFCDPNDGDEKVYYNDDMSKEMRFISCHPNSSDKVLQWIKEKINSI